MRRLVSFFLLAALPFAPALAQGEGELEAAPLAYALSPGLKVQYASEDRMQATTKVRGQDGESTTIQTVETLFTLEVGETNNERGLAEASFTTESIRITFVDPNGNETIIDSNDPAAVEKNPDAAFSLAMVGVPIKFVLERTGGVLAANGEGARRIVGARLEGAAPAEDLEAMLSVALSDAALKRTIASALVRVPGRLTPVGEHWESRFDLPAPGLGSLTFIVESSLTKLGRQGNERLATIDERIQVLSLARQGQTQGRITDGSGQGRVSFDTTRGLLLSSRSETKVQMELLTLDDIGEVITNDSVIEIGRSLRMLPVTR